MKEIKKALSMGKGDEDDDEPSLVKATYEKSRGRMMP